MSAKAGFHAVGVSKSGESECLQESFLPSSSAEPPRGACPPVCPTEKSADRVYGALLTDSFTEPPIGLDNMRENSEDCGWSISYHQMGEGCLELSSSVWECGNISLMRESSNLCLQMICVPPPDMLTILIPCEKHNIWFNGRSLNDRSMAVLFPRDRLRFVTRGGTLVISMHVPLSLLDAHSTRPAALTSDFSSESIAAVIEDSLSVVQLRDLMNSSRVGDTGPEPERRRATEAELLDVLVTALSSTADKNVVGKDCLPASKVLSRVDTFLAQSATEPVKMVQLVRFAGVSERSLERMCRSIYDITPCEYIAAFRLNAVREDFLRPGLQNKTISEIAMDNGFRHLGRFSADFRKYFGRSPRQYRKEESQSTAA